MMYTVAFDSSINIISGVAAKLAKKYPDTHSSYDMLKLENHLLESFAGVYSEVYPYHSRILRSLPKSWYSGSRSRCNQWRYVS